jgi:hypothetical protein
VSTLQDTLACNEIRHLFMAGGCVKREPLQHFCVLVHLATDVGIGRIGQDGPGRLKLGSLALPPAMCKAHPHVLKSDKYFRCCGAPKLTPLKKIHYVIILWLMRSMTVHVPQTSTICRKWTVIKSVLWLRSNSALVGSGCQGMAVSTFKFGITVSGMCMYVHVS